MKIFNVSGTSQIYKLVNIVCLCVSLYVCLYVSVCQNDMWRQGRQKNSGMSASHLTQIKST